MKKVVVVNFVSDKYRKYGYVLEDNRVNSYVQFADENKWIDNGDIVLVTKRREKASQKKINELRTYIEQYESRRFPKWLQKFCDKANGELNNYQVNLMTGFFRANAGNLAEYLRVGEG